MSAIRFYLDEHVHPAVASGLRTRGIDVVTTKEALMLGASDEEQIAFARREERVIYTQDSDFLRLHASGINHYGIAYAPRRTPIRRILGRLLLIAQALDSDDMRNCVEFI